MEIDPVSNIVMHGFEFYYRDLDFALFAIGNIINLTSFKQMTIRKLSEIWTWFQRKNINNLLIWVDRKPICYKCQNCEKKNTMSETIVFNNIQNPEVTWELNVRVPKVNSFIASTPVGSSLLENVRLLQLENEVQELRKQISQLTLKLPKNSICSTTSVPPPPPPPPMPFLTPSTNSMCNIKDQIRKNKVARLSNEDYSSIKTSTPLTSLADIMKGAKNIKLKKIARSPGGTPIRKPKSLDNGTDLSAVLARAMKRRFDKIHPKDESPETSGENSFQSFSPDTSFGVQKRRHKIFLSPLKEINS